MRTVFAYLDPGTGSMILQLVVGGVAGVIAFARFRWHAIKRWLQRGDQS
jgi:hypothetical protein